MNRTNSRRASLAAAVAALLLAATIPSLAQAATVTKTNTIDGSVDLDSLLRTVTFAAGDFAPGSVITQVTVVLQFAKIDDFGSTTSATCGPPPVTGEAFEANDELFFRLTSPAATTINLIAARTYDVEGYGGQVTVTLDDAATSTLSGIPATGTFNPSQALSAFAGQSPVGDWTVTAGDNGLKDPLCFYEASVTITADVPPPACGNSIVEGTEQCDGGPCCSSECTFASAGSVCRAATGPCDWAELCTGEGAACPMDVLQPSTFTCRAATDACDLPDNCTGLSDRCPVDDRFQPATFVCRPATGDCDLAESCTGTSASCPVDQLQPATVTCRAATDGCDLAATCTGLSPGCPANQTRVPTSGCTVNGVKNQTCQGGSTEDLILGTSGNDIIRGGGAADTLKGNAGDDVLCGEGGDDVLLGGTGNDELLAGPGNDVLKGEAGNDALDGGTEDDTLVGGTGTDALDGGPGDDKLTGNEDRDTLLGDGGNDILNGGDGDDTLDGEADVDDLTGGAGVDLCLNGETLATCE